VDFHDVRRAWANRDGEFSPAYYAYYGPNETSRTVRRILEQYLDRDAAILEVGCSSGRHLSHLADHGFENLAGIEVNEEAFDVMAESYPDLADDGRFYHDAIETVVGDFADGQFDAIFSVETLQHLHPDVDWVFAELARATDDLLITVENEGDAADEEGADPSVSYVQDEFPLFHRDWHGIFTHLGLVEVATSEGDHDTVRAFRDPTR